MSALAGARAPFPWFGGKHKLADALVGLLPPHLVYVEPFGGAASVLLRKGPSRLEVYNDLDGGVVTFFRVLRDQPDELERRLRLTPFSRSEFELCRTTWQDQEDEAERARRWYVRVEQAFAGTPLTTGWGGEILERAGFERHEFDVLCSSAATRADSSHFARTEVVWRHVNHDARLFDVAAATGAGNSEVGSSQEAPDA